MKKITVALIILIASLSLCGCSNGGQQAKPSYNVFFNTNGGSLIDYITVEEGRIPSMPIDPVKREYVFMGWYLDNGTFNNSADAAFSSPISSDITVYAKWVSVYELLDNPKVVITLFDDRQIKLELYPAIAPETCANFLSLIEEGYYTNTVFHRIIDDFMIQAGHLTLIDNRTADKAPKDNIIGEFSANGVPNPLRHTAGVLSMARADGYDSASTQFFICVGDSPHLNGLYAAFGRVADEESLAIATELGGYPTYEYSGMKDFPFTPQGQFVTIKTIEVLE